MITIGIEDILGQHQNFVRAYSDGTNAPFLLPDFVASAFPKLEDRATAIKLAQLRKKYGGDVKSIYPYEVRLPKSLEAMMNEDFEPSRVFQVNGPIVGPYSNIWFGDATDGVAIRWGYVNGDSRYISTNAFDDATVHGFLGGKTGQGKSVTLNAFIYTCCMEYPPWEVVLTLSDAKIVEFKSIALGHPMPHIDFVAATCDTDYLVSMLEVKKKEMDLRNSIFPKAAQIFNSDIKNIKDFRKVTGLMLPRNVIIFDECTAMFRGAGKKARLIEKYIDDFARLGRSTGMHILLTSQEVSSDLPAGTLANMSLRAAMGCDAPVSERILGNPEAVYNINKRGYMLTNTNVSSKDSAASNVMIRVPFMPPEKFKQISSEVIARGEEYGYPPHVQFFDGEALMYEKDYRKFVDSFEARRNRIVVGPPSFIIEHGDECVQYEMAGGDLENICIFANSENPKIRGLKLLKINFLKHANMLHKCMVVDTMFSNKGNLEELTLPKNIYEENSFTTSKFISEARNMIYRRRLCLAVEKEVFQYGDVSDEADALFYSVYEKDSPDDTKVNRSRFHYCMKILKSDASLRKGLQISDSNYGSMVGREAKICITMCNRNGCQSRQLTSADLQMTFYWIFGMERMIGIGRDGRSSNVALLKEMLQDCAAVNVRFIIFTGIFDYIGEISSYIGAFLLEGISSSQANKVKVGDTWPDEPGSAYVYLFRPSITDPKTRVQKALKMLLDGELPI